MVEKILQRQGHSYAPFQRSTKEINRPSFALIFSLQFATVAVADQSLPPDSWEMAFRNEKHEVWDRLLGDDGKITAAEVIAENYGRGSHHDGDRQVATAFSLLEIEDDPIPLLRAMMKEKTPERRAFGVMVAACLGDVRLEADINKLMKDQSKLGSFPGDWFWDTVGDAASMSFRELERGGVAGDWITHGGIVAPWLNRKSSIPVKPSK